MQTVTKLVTSLRHCVMVHNRILINICQRIPACVLRKIMQNPAPDGIYYVGFKEGKVVGESMNSWAVEKSEKPRVMVMMKKNKYLINKINITQNKYYTK